VVVIGWHYPSDALAWVCVGLGVALLCDGLTRVAIERWRLLAEEREFRATGISRWA
jgi:membrane-associated phospholipid phosphatase